jgi:hypothetical protein
MVIRALGRFMVENGRQEWGRRMNQAALIARSIIDEQGTAAGKQLPNLERIQPHAHRGFELLEAWVEQRTPAPPGQCIPRGGTIVSGPVETARSKLLVLP